jgi:FkbM family methyltransferase
MIKGLLKEGIGRCSLTLGTVVPGSRPVLARIGMRTSQGLFGKRTVSIKLSNGRSFRLRNVDESYLAFQLFWHGGDYYEPLTRSLLSRLIKPGGTFFDIGAHVGFFTLTTAISNETRIVAFEPNPKNFALLEGNIAENNLTNTGNGSAAPRLVCEPYAISDTDGKATLYLTESDMSASLMKDFQAEDTRQIGELRVSTCSLDNYLQKHPVTGPLVIKVDIEGHEPAFFRGATKTIAAHKPDIVLEVLNDQNPDAVAFLKRLGYRFYPVTDGDLVELEAPKLIKRYPFLFLNHLLSTRPRQEIKQIFKEVKAETESIDLRQTSKHFPREQWPLLWKSEG